MLISTVLVDQIMLRLKRGSKVWPT